MNQQEPRTSAIEVYLETLGCAKNRVDSEIMLFNLLERGLKLVEDPKDARVIVVNTCGFIASAVDESLERILSLSQYKTEGVCEKLLVAGCLSERYKEGLLDEVSEIDGLLGTSDYTQIAECVARLMKGKERISFLGEGPDYSEKNFDQKRVLSTKAHYAYLKIAEGCSNQCSFCNIPQLRGEYRSRPTDSIKAEMKQLIEGGTKEVVLISQDSSSFGADLSVRSDLFDLCRNLLDTTKEDFWLRIFYAYPNRFPQKLFSLMKEDPRLVPYLDMPFQHIADPILKAMRRQLTEKQIRTLMEKATHSVPEIAFRTTLMVGFPGETEKDFQKLLSWVEEGWFYHLGVFAYSNEDNVLAATFDNQIEESLKQERLQMIMEAQQKVVKKKNLSQVGQIQKILVEDYSEETELLLQGRNQYQAPDVDGVVLINEGEANKGCFHQVQITQAHPYDLVGKVVS